MSARHPTAAEFEERAQVKQLRDQADQTAAEAARTLAELGARLADAARPRAMARRLAAVGRDAVARSLREVASGVTGQRGARRPALVAIPVLAVAVAVFLGYRRFAAGDRE